MGICSSSFDFYNNFRVEELSKDVQSSMYLYQDRYFLGVPKSQSHTGNENHTTSFSMDYSVETKDALDRNRKYVWLLSGMVLILREYLHEDVDATLDLLKLNIELVGTLPPDTEFSSRIHRFHIRHTIAWTVGNVPRIECHELNRFLFCPFIANFDLPIYTSLTVKGTCVSLTDVFVTALSLLRFSLNETTYADLEKIMMNHDPHRIEVWPTFSNTDTATEDDESKREVYSRCNSKIGKNEFGYSNLLYVPVVAESSSMRAVLNVQGVQLDSELDPWLWNVAPLKGSTFHSLRRAQAWAIRGQRWKLSSVHSWAGTYAAHRNGKLLKFDTSDKHQTTTLRAVSSLVLDQEHVNEEDGMGADQLNSSGNPAVVGALQLVNAQVFLETENQTSWTIKLRSKRQREIVIPKEIHSPSTSSTVLALVGIYDYSYDACLLFRKLWRHVGAYHNLIARQLIHISFSKQLEETNRLVARQHLFLICEKTTGKTTSRMTFQITRIEGN